MHVLHQQQLRAFHDFTAAFLPNAGASTAEHMADALRTLFATTAVATRQWYGPENAYSWLTPLRINQHCWQPMAGFAQPDPETAAPAAGN